MQGDSPQREGEVGLRPALTGRRLAKRSAVGLATAWMERWH